MNKKVIITISVIAAIILLVALICVVFIVGDIKVLTTSEMLLDDEVKDKIIVDSKIVKHSSIFALSEEIAINNIEKLNPDVKVLKIERKIPNKVVINLTSRVGMFAVPIVEGGYWILDRELKVINRVETLDDGFYAVTKGVVVPEDLEVGDFLEGIDWLESIINGVENASFVGKRFGSFFKEVTLVDKTITLLTNTGLKMLVPYVDNETTIKIISNEYQIYLSLDDKSRSQGSLVLKEDAICYIP